MNRGGTGTLTETNRALGTGTRTRRTGGDGYFRHDPAQLGTGTFEIDPPNRIAAIYRDVFWGLREPPPIPASHPVNPANPVEKPTGFVLARFDRIAGIN